ncbi:MAG: NUDIX domain-containing protein [archaeon]|nr:NUDIX domain-containing protein [archaeon]
MSEDIVDIYTKERKPTGRTAVRYTDLGPGNHRLVIHICIFNPRNEMLIQKRVAGKKSFPGYWDVSVGGGVSSGETTQIAAERELKEELGLDHVFDTAPAITLDTHDVFDDFFVMNLDIDTSELALQKEEVESARWASFEEIMFMMDSGEFIPYHKGLIDYLFHLGRNGLTEYTKD